MRIVNKAFLCLFVGLTAASCQKGLDLKPADVIIEENAFLNLPSLERGIIGVYSTFNGAYDQDIYATALFSDEATLPTENNTGRGVIAYRWQHDPGISEITGAWAAYYFGIDRANRILVAADQLSLTDAKENETRSRIRGEALALRAFGHLQLLINFSNSFEPNAASVPYIEVSETFGKPSRLTVQQVMTKINADLEAAKSAIPASYTTRTRITLPAVHAIQARAALYAKNWDLAIAAATAAINSVPLDTRVEHPLVWTDASNAGVIWKQRRESGQIRLGDVFYDRTQQRIMYGPSKELRDLFNQSTDVRYASLVLSRGSGRFSLGKYVGGDAANPGLADVKVFRTAEMYLIRAEAYAEKGMLSQGAADLNALRAARISNYTPASFGTKEELVNAIVEERFKELAFEGQRVGDLRRRGLPITRIPEDALNAQGATTLAPTDRRYYYPIPDAEILANENLQQNPGYQ